MDAVELRRHLWTATHGRTLAGVDDVESAARGDAAAVARLVAQSDARAGAESSVSGRPGGQVPGQAARRLA